MTHRIPPTMDEADLGAAVAALRGGAVERLRAVLAAWDLAEVYNDTPAGNMDSLCDDLTMVLDALGRQ